MCVCVGVLCIVLGFHVTGCGLDSPVKALSYKEEEHLFPYAFLSKCGLKTSGEKGGKKKTKKTKPVKVFRLSVNLRGEESTDHL